MDVRTMTPVGTVKPGTEKQQAPGHEARGYALAQFAIAEVQGQANALRRIVGRLVAFDVLDRTAFMKEIATHLRGITKNAKAAADGEHRRYGLAARSARVRLSELNQIAKALNAGMDVEIKRDPDTGHPAVDAVGTYLCVQPFHTIVADARLILGSQAKGRGRPGKVFPDKVKALALAHKWGGDRSANAAELIRASELLAEMAKTIMREPAAAAKK